MGDHIFSKRHQQLVLLIEVHHTHQCRAKISYLNSSELQACTLSDCITFPSSGHPLCPHFLSHSWPAKSPMTLCCYASVLFWENLGQLGWDASLMGVELPLRFDVKKSTSAYSSVRPALSVRSCSQTCPPWPKCEFWCKLWRKCSSARGAEWAVSIQSTFQKAAEAVILAGCHRD